MRPYLRTLAYVVLILALYLIASIIIGFLGGFYFSTIHDVDLDAVETLVGTYMVWIAAGSGLLMLAFLYLLFWGAGGNLWTYSRFRKVPSMTLFSSLGGGVGLSFLVTGLIKLLQLEQLFPEHQEMMEQLVLQPGFLLSMITVGIFIPIFEEIMYRGVIMNRLRASFPITFAIVLQALIFGVMHGNVLQGGYTFIIAIIFGLYFFWSASLWVPIMMHIGMNSTSVIRAHFLPEPWAPATLLLAGALLLLLSMFYYHRQQRPRQKTEGS